MATITREANGYFGGRALLQQTGKQGGARHVFAKIDDIKNDLVFPTFGGQLDNPFPGPAKIYAGDLFWFQTDGDGNGQKVTLLKTYRTAKAKTTSETYITLEKAFRHKPFVGDLIGVAPDAINEASTRHGMITNVVDAGETWQVTIESLKGDSIEDGSIFVEVNADGKVVCKNINAVAAWDYDMVYSEALTSNNADNKSATRYYLTPSLRGTMIKSKMSPVPKCYEVFNISNIDGWFRVDALNKPVGATMLGV